MGRALVIFDFDGTVADSFAASMAAYNRVAPQLRLRHVTPAEVPGLRRMSPGQVMQALGVPMWKVPRLMIALRADLIEHFDSVKPVAGIVQAVRDLDRAGHHLAIVTSNSLGNVRGFLVRHGLDCFPSVVAGASIFGKSHRLRRLLKAARLDGARAVYVGDTTPDIRAAREAGTAAVAVTWGYSDREPLATEAPDAIVEETAALPAAIARVLAGA
jgi:phosphoglycolate phosphatase